MSGDSNASLVQFLRILADSIEKNTLANEELFKVAEFYMAFLFRQLTCEGSDSKSKSIESFKESHGSKESHGLKDEFSQKEFQKFITLGWYVYTQLLDGETL